MNKTELVNAMAAKTGMTKVAAKQAMTACFDAIQAELKKGEKVTLIGFGTFSVVKRKARTAKNPVPARPSKFPPRKWPSSKPAASSSNKRAYQQP